MITMTSDVSVMEYDESNVKMMECPSVNQALVDERSLNFATSPGDEFDLAFAKKPKTIRDPMSHRIIEKRRRDRMNNCLADLSRLIPTNYLKQGQGRIEKTEIIEMAIRHIKDLSALTNKQGVSDIHLVDKEMCPSALKSSLPDRFLGFKECQDEVMRFLVEIEGWDAHDQLCSRMMSHLEQAGEKFRIMNDDSLSQAAKEEQYRHVEEDISAVRAITPNTLEPGGPGTANYGGTINPVTVPHYPTPQISPPRIGPHPQPLPQSEIPNTQGTFINFDSFANAQQITQEHLKRDKHLWTLLTSQYNSKSMGDDSGLSTGPGSNNTKSDSSKYSMHENGMYKVPKIDPSAYGSINGSQASMDTGSDRNDSSVYKFKHNITKRFSEETTSPKMLHPSDSSSISSRGEQKRSEKLKRKFRHIRSRSPSSTISSQYPNSDSSNNNGSSNGESSSAGEDTKVPCLLPGFVLHPVGTHYIPLSVHPSSMGPDFFAKVTQQGPRVFHPISIPVNFGGPLLYMKGFSMDLKHVDSGIQSLSSEGSNSGSSSACPSENSPIPEIETVKNNT